ncbi:DUF4190 domain-containing protein [Microlunatus speluncae]|uniref:DUF4190 domain-containing protein n=1 Tax=Microlunatus speluncae TaxID=2594267 RepID=UPI00126612FF|nr:DUF4190 domain-containing protein [Microlunatus speluncae]
MNEQHPGGPTGGQHDSNSGGPGRFDDQPSPFSREAAGEDAGLGPVPDPGSTEPDGFVGHPGGPAPDASPATSYPPASNPYGSSTYSPGYYSAGSSSSAAESAGPEAPYAPPAGAAAPADPYGSPTSAPAPDQGYGTPQGYGAGAPPAYPANPYDTGGYNYRAAPPYGYPTEQHAQGTTSLVLGILGITVCPPAGVVGFVISSRARKEIQAAPGRYSNSGMVTAGWVLGILAIVATAFWVLYVIVIIFAMIATGGS